ncbi:acetate kinase [Trinickia symbiotica]|uniref:Acetate kinase n=1 Tax=Trinickia symbiotica TaxID=863227 RepID=A0A2N7X559_9BURK|nr:acetate/propionate family kinase [Trinickia symbiotica]PMS36682.1 acetate kinase [Trinickia symbiotica]PPK46120.1 acetate kinase [Trinickia symbiotica]
MSAPLLLTFNPGSSTIKLGLFRVTDGVPVRCGAGSIDFGRVPLALEISNAGQSATIELSASLTEDLHEAIDETLDWLSTHFAFNDLASVGHRVVHGGDRFSGPVAIDRETLAAIEALTPLAPLHQPESVRLIRAIRELRPHLLQVASFDTAFHRTQADIVRRFAIPRHYFDEGIKRYGFHGLSYQYIATRLAREFPKLAAGKVIVAHLGAGASLCALDACVSRDTSMGFSTLDGVPMATRCGSLDPGVVLHLLERRGLSPREIEDILYRQSGLLGLSGTSADMRELNACGLPHAREAIDLFSLRTAGEIARLTATLGGLDGLVFTAGIGEHQPDVRASVCEHLQWLGVDLNARLNEDNARIISNEGTPVTVLVLATDEESVIARETASVHRCGERLPAGV